MRFLNRATLLAAFFFLSTAGFAQTITTFAGGGSSPTTGGLAVAQSFDTTRAVISDRFGGFYFSTSGQFYNAVYHVDSDGKLTIIVGGSQAGFSGDGGPAILAQLSFPRGLALDGSGNLYIADESNSRVRKVTPAGIISTVAGTGNFGFAGDNGPAVSAQLRSPNSVAIDGFGNLYIADGSNHRIRKVTADGVIRTIAGVGGSGGFSGDDGPAVTAQLNSPGGMAFDATGNLYFADRQNRRVRRITPAGIISTAAGNGGTSFSGNGGQAVLAQIGTPSDVAIDPAGNLLIATSTRIRKVFTDGIITTIAGGAVQGFSGDGGSALFAAFSSPIGIAADSDGSVFIADSFNRRIRRIAPDGIINTVAGNGLFGFGGDGGPASSALLNTPLNVTVDPSGNVFIADTFNNRIRKVTPTGTISSFAGNGVNGFSGDTGSAVAARLNYPTALAVDPAGNVFIIDCGNHIRKVTTNGLIDTFSNVAWAFCQSSFYFYYYYDSEAGGGIAADAGGNLFVADTFHHRIFKITPDGVSSILAGTGASGFGGDNGPAELALLNQPRGVALDSAGNLYVADTANRRVRRITPGGTISTVAGNGISGFSGDGGPATAAQLVPTSVAVDAAGNLFIADPGNGRVRRVTAGIIQTVAGNGMFGFTGDGGIATSARLSLPSGVALDSVGNLLIADTNNHRIRRVRLVLAPPTLTSVAPDVAAPGTSVNVGVVGTNFASPLTLSSGSGITIGTVSVQTDSFATANFDVAQNATLGARNLTVTTDLGTSNGIPFNVVPPFPDLSISSSHSGNLGVGFNGTYTLNVTNAGLSATTGPITVTDVLPNGLTFVSVSGAGWSCSATGQTVVCSNPASLAAGASMSLTLTVAVVSGAASTVIHAPTVTVNGDPITANNAGSDTTVVATPAVVIELDPALGAVQQGTIGLAVPFSFPQDVTGKLKLTFVSNAAIPADDPAIQFATGGREVSFTIPANSQQARFGASGRVGFQSGSVAGTLTFEGTLQSGSVETKFSTTRTIPRQAPVLQAVRREGGIIGLAALITLMSTMREVTSLDLQFTTTPSVRPSCGTAAGCTVSGSTLTLDVKSLFDGWFASDTTFGSLSTLRVPFTIQGDVSGFIVIRLRNSVGLSNPMPFSVP